MRELVKNRGCFCPQKKTNTFFAVKLHLRRDSRGNACKVVVRKANLEMRKKNFTIRAPLDWNNLPQETVQSKTIDEFKWKLDKHWKAIGIDMYEFERR